MKLLLNNPKWVSKVIDSDGFRANVGIVLANRRRQLFWGRRIGQDAWQFPQGGVHENETAEETLFRELKEEVGLDPEDVAIRACTSEWLRYRIPKHMLRYYRKPLCIGQKQKWFLLMLTASEQKIRLDLSDSPEFDSWAWVKYWHPAHNVINFKREVYRQALEEFAPILHDKGKR